MFLMLDLLFIICKSWSLYRRLLISITNPMQYLNLYPFAHKVSMNVYAKLTQNIKYLSPPLNCV